MALPISMDIDELLRFQSLSQVGNTCIDMGFNCTAPTSDGLGTTDGRNAPASCDDPRLVQLTADYQRNMKALREAALNAGKFVSLRQSFVALNITSSIDLMVGTGLANALDRWCRRFDRRREHCSSGHQIQLCTHPT